MFKLIARGSDDHAVVAAPPRESSSWSERVFTMASQGVWNDDSSTDYYKSQFLSSNLPTDNASVLCPNVDVAYHGEGSLHMVLRWIKFVVVKMARSYYAFPIVLVAIPLILGILIGFVVARKWSLPHEGPRRQRQSPFRGLTSWFGRLLTVLFADGRLSTPDSRTNELSTRKSHMETTEGTKVENELDSGVKRRRFPESPEAMQAREEAARAELLDSKEAQSESGVDPECVPRHVAVIMDGNRRYGKAVYGNPSAGHWDGSKKVLELAKWCISERIKVLTIYAFSTENWQRDAVEVASLMTLLAKYSEELRKEAIARNIRVRILSTDTTQIPWHVKSVLERLEADTAISSPTLEMNVCLSYGSRGEIVEACRNIATSCVSGKMDTSEITQQVFQNALLSGVMPDPDVLIRTSGEVRLSNFLLWQLAYTELFFVDVNWPAFEKRDLLDVIRRYANGRKRRFGK